jgi:hypothetical protein
LPVLNKDGDVVGDKISTAIAASFETRKAEAAEKAPVEKAEKSDEPQNGKFLLQGGISQFSGSSNLATGETTDTSQSTAPSVALGLELWTSPNWFVSFELLQSIFKADNSLAGSSPHSLNYSYSKYSGSLGYYFLLNKEDQKAPKIGAQIGYESMKTDVTDTTPRAFASSVTSGFLIKVTGILPLREYPIELGASFDIFLNPSTSETPEGPGSTDSHVTSFGFNASYEASKNLRYRFDIILEQVKTDTTGGEFTSSTDKLTSEMIGIEYLF